MQQQPKSRHAQKYFNLIYNHSQWKDIIKPSIEKIANKTFKTSQLIDKMKQFHFLTQTHRKSGKNNDNFQYTFSELISGYQKQLPDLYSDMAKLVLQYEKNPPKFPILYSGIPQSHTYSKKQMLLLMSMMSMSLIPQQDFQFQYRFPHSNDFKWIFSNDPWKTQCTIEYLKKQFASYKNLGQKYQNQKLSLRRLVKIQSLEQAIKKCANKPMILPIIAENDESIEEYYGDVKIDFANKFIGGGAFHSGCVQQEIMFVNHPEMYSSALFCQMMKQNQAIEFIGYKKYFKNTGYGWTAANGGQQEHKYEYDEQNRAKQYISAIDALHFPQKNSVQQFSSEIIKRQLFKAYVGFDEAGNKQSRIISGNWGCGAFNGNIALKYFIQWIACSMAGKKLVYVPFGFKDKINNQKINNAVSKMTVGQIYKLIMDPQQLLRQKRNMYQFLQSKLSSLGLL